MTNSVNDQERLKELKNKADKLNNAAIRLNADVDNAQENLEKYQKEALKDFGTSDLDELIKKLSETRAKNAAIISKVEKEIELLSTDLAEKQEKVQKIKSGA